VTELFIAARPEGFKIAVHAGAQTTHDTVALADHAMETGADAVAVIAPPYFPLDEHELLAHFRAAASACAPVPFFVYEFVGRSGYAVPISGIEQLRTEAPNLRGLKVSDTPWSAVQPYLLHGLDLFVGLEPLVLEGMKAGAAGAVSGLATAFPETVSSLVHDRSDAAHDRVVNLRGALQGIPFISAMKHLLARRGILADPSVRAPLRSLTDAERETVGTLL